MKILAFWDVYWRIGRKALSREIDVIKGQYTPDLCIANIDNCSSGRWAVEKHIYELESLGIDFFSGGDHFFDNITDIQEYLKKDDAKLLRPANFYEQRYYDIPWKGYSLIEKNGKNILFIHLIGEVFMNHNVYSPFLKFDEILSEVADKGLSYDVCIVDFHCEASAEFYGLAHFIDGRAGAIFGTHTHVQTNDEKILPWGTGLISDVWMNGALFGVIGAEYESVRKRFITGINKWLISQSLEKEYVISAVSFEIWDDGKCVSVEKIRKEWSL